ncbi:galactosyltransferase-related protein [Fulvivirga sp. M361]|uniref:galactosyltransferase-related protein n=1 Tax=Fulvivirga sp. M361 TaxID=2594266 RepID=UPI0016256F87|nr:galactosyltransferase-related protein [Fulvivirga sp. M361]
MSAKPNLLDTTFLFPVRIDSIDRLENICHVIEFIRSNFVTNFLVLEADRLNTKLLQKLLPEVVSLKFTEDLDPVFHRTYYINQLVKMATTPIVAIWDADVLVTKTQIVKAVESIRTRNASFVSPYDGLTFDTSKIVRELYFKKGDYSVLERNKGKMNKIYGPDHVGGCFFARRQDYIDSGLENERFYGWGHEDGERVNRWKILGYQFTRIDGCMFHLTHSRGLNSGYHTNKQGEIKKYELVRLAQLTRNEMLKEVKSWDETRLSEF